MTDLVARLRSRREFASLDGSRWYTTTGQDRDCAEAAEEIERLRAELAARPIQRQLDLATRQWDHWKIYALELHDKLQKHEPGGSVMHLNTALKEPT